MAVQPDHEVEILDDGVGPVAADGQQVILTEQTERPRDDQIAAQAVPAETTEQEGAQIFHHLHSREEPPRHARVRDPAVLHGAPVGDPHRAPDGRDPAPQEERPGQT